MFDDPNFIIEMQLCGLADEDGNPIDLNNNCEAEQHQKTVTKENNQL